MASKKNMNISVNPDQVMYTNISKSKDGYNSARMVVKTGEKEYMAISYEWEGDGIPDFVMNLMGFMQANEMNTGIVDEYAEEYAAKHGKRMNKNMDDEEDDDMKKKKNKKKTY